MIKNETGGISDNNYSRYLANRYGTRGGGERGFMMKYNNVDMTNIKVEKRLEILLLRNYLYQEEYIVDVKYFESDDELEENPQDESVNIDVFFKKHENFSKVKEITVKFNDEIFGDTIFEVIHPKTIDTPIPTPSSEEPTETPEKEKNPQPEEGPVPIEFDLFSEETPSKEFTETVLPSESEIETPKKKTVPPPPSTPKATKSDSVIDAIYFVNFV